MTVTAPETEARQALITAVKDEFTPEKLPVLDDRLHGSLGEQEPVAGCFPDHSTATRDQKLVNEYFITVQVFSRWEKMADRAQTVSPALIEEWAERFRRCIQKEGVDPQTGRVWYFDLEIIRYRPDPTGNITRFEATVIARGNNSALIETIG
jgi:hypothetical protein